MKKTLSDQELHEKIKRVAEYYGLEIQLEKLAEECSEYAAFQLKKEYLISAISNGRGGKSCNEQMDDCQENNFRELADVLVVSEQIKYLLLSEPEFNEKIKGFMNEKINRQLRRIEEDL